LAVAAELFTALSKPNAMREEGSARSVTVALDSVDKSLLLIKKHFS
jgi:hypothetical protein